MQTTPRPLLGKERRRAGQISYHFASPAARGMLRDYGNFLMLAIKKFDYLI